MTDRRGFLAQLPVRVGCAAFPTLAQAPYPSRPIRLVIPFPAGGTTDLTARAIAQPLGDALGQPVTVDYRPGADGLIAGEAVARAAPDGYTLLFGSATGLSAASSMRKTMPYDPLADFTPISRLGTFGFFLYVSDRLPVRTFGELLAYIRANPGVVNYGTGTATSVVASAQLARTARLNIVHIPYKGDAPLIADTIAGHVQMMFAAGVALPHVQAGKLRALATLLPSRSPLVPEVPTLGELGIGGMSIVPWGGLFGPPRMPREIVNRIGREVAKVLLRADVRDQLGKLAFEPQASSPDDFALFVSEQLAVWRKAIFEAGIQPE
jgi:tripartite-type tricarboxylate transporter receptor subunit TctC